MSYNLVRLHLLTGKEKYAEQAKKQLDFMSAEARQYPAGYAMFLLALSDALNPPEKITAVLKEQQDLTDLPCKVSLNTILHVVEGPTQEYSLQNDKTTFYICRSRSCQPPVNELPAASVWFEDNE